MRVLVCGGRDFNDRDFVWNTLTEWDSSVGGIDVVIHGAATGADSEAMIWAQTCGRKHAPFVAEWRKHGKGAGPIRNQRMLDEGKPDMVIAFPGGRGTADMKRRARAANLDVIEASPGHKQERLARIGRIVG